MDEEILTFCNIEKNKFYHHKTRTFLGDVDIENLVSNKISFDEEIISTLVVTRIMVMKLNH